MNLELESPPGNSQVQREPSNVWPQVWQPSVVPTASGPETLEGPGTLGDAMEALGPVSLSQSLQFDQQQSTEAWELSSRVQAVAEGTGFDGIIQTWQCALNASSPWPWTCWF